LAGSIESSLGALGFAELKTSVEGKLETKLNWEISSEVQRSFKLSAPRCGRRTDTTYQLVRDYELQYAAESWLFHTAWTRRLTEYVGTYHQEPFLEAVPELCRCDAPPPPPYDHLVWMDMNGASMRVAGRLNEDKLLLDFGEGTVELSGVGRRLGGQITVRMPRSLLPPSLLFLSGDERTSIHVTLVLEHGLTRPFVEHTLRSAEEQNQLEYGAASFNVVMEAQALMQKADDSG
jgi:hypothetical protein